MRKFITRFGLLFPLAFFATQALADSRRASPDGGSLFVVKGRVFGSTKADAVYIREGQIEAVGTRAEIACAVPAEVAVLDAEGGVILPGFRDAHIHMLSGSSWLNSRALTLARILDTTADPPNGRIDREADGKTPAGVLLEAAAEPALKAVPEPDRATKLEALDRAVQHCLSLGITAVDDLESDPQAWDLYEALLTTGRLPIRVTVSLPLEGNLEQYEAYRRRGTSPFLQFGFLKGFVDGVIESKTAFLLAPYVDSEECGKPLVDGPRLRELIARAGSRDFAVRLHAVGDGAVRLSLDAFADVRCGCIAPQIRGRIEHIELLDLADAVRFRELGVTASMMPFHAVPSGAEPDNDVWSGNLAGRKRGSERLEHAFAWRELLDAGAVLAFGSDWPVMSADPLWGIAMAVTRKNELGKPEGGWHLHQRISAEEAVAAYTVGAARLRRCEKLCSS